MTASPASAPFVRAGLVAGLVAIIWWGTAVTSPMPPVWPIGPQPVYSIADPPALVALEPVLHAAWLDTPGRPLVGLTAVLVVLGASGVAIVAGASTPAAILVLVALVLDTAFSAALAHAAGLALAVGFVWLAAGAAFDDRSRLVTRRPWFNPAAAAGLWLVAVWVDWIAVIAWPVVFAAFRRRPDRPARGLWTIGSLAAGAIAFLGYFAWMAHRANAMTVGDAALGWRDALWVAFVARPRMPIGSYTAPELTTRLGYVLMALALVGLLLGSLGRWWRRAALLTAAFAVSVAMVWSEWQAEVTRFTLWSLAPLSAVGLTWVAGQGRRPLAITLVLGAIAVIESIVLGARPLEGAEARRFRDALASAIDTRTGSGALAVVAEDTRIDSALAAWLASKTPRGQRVGQDGGAVARAREEGRVVLAGSVGRRHLELSGVSFADTAVIIDPAPFRLSEADGMFQCAMVRTDRWSQLPGLEYTGRLGIHLPPAIGGELHVIVGDALVLPVHAETPDGRELALRQDTLTGGPGVSPPPADYWIDEGAPPVESRWIHRVRIPADPVAPSLVSLELGRRAPRVIARLIGYADGAQGRICAAPVGAVHLREGGAEMLDLGDETLFGAGWYGREGRGDGRFRWADGDAVVLVRSAVKTDVDVTIEASAAAVTGRGGATTINLRVNGVELGTQPMAAGGQRYTWRAPAGAWLAGTNELWWTTSRAVRPADSGGADTRSLALRVTGITVTRP